MRFNVFARRADMKRITCIICLVALILIGASIADLHADEDTTGDLIRFAIIGDRTGGHVPGIYGQIIDIVERMKPDFAITVGDQVEGYVDDTTIMIAELREYDSIVAPLSMALHFTPGNHDIWSDLSEEFYINHVGRPFYSFDFEDLHIVILDNSCHNSTEDFTSEQLSRLNSDLARNSGANHIFVFMHKPFWFDTVAEAKPDTLHSLFVKYGVEAVFTGHFHRYFSGEFDGITYTNIGSSGGGADVSPTGMHYHFAWVTVTSDELNITPITLEGARSWDDLTVAQLKFINQIQFKGVNVDNALPIGDDLNPTEQQIEIRITNLNDDISIEDTIRWDCPDNWTIEPAVMPYAVDAGTESILTFSCANSGDLYPLPQLDVKYPYADGKTCDVRQQIRVARVADCYYGAKSITIDGHITEDIWGDPETVLFHPGGGEMQTEPVKFFFAYDSNYLYLAARCEESVMDSLVAKAKRHDGAVYADDCVGYFIQPDIDQGIAYQIYINPLGHVFDQKLEVGDDGYTDYDSRWDSEYAIKTHHGDSFWSIEAAIPLMHLKAKTEPGTKWGINFRRKQARLNTAADWQTPIDYNPNSYGVLKLH